jgi:hypothetical protein
VDELGDGSSMLECGAGEGAGYVVLPAVGTRRQRGSPGTRQPRTASRERGVVLAPPLLRAQVPPHRAAVLAGDKRPCMP